jgi:TonB-linked SusC/RagA family outer membrane protein
MYHGVHRFRIITTVLLMLMTVGAMAQNVTITGTVYDSSGQTIIGANVHEKGSTNKGTITDMNGNYKLQVSGKLPLVVSFIGMKTQEVNFKGKTIVDVTLEDDVKKLDEVVVIGYQTVKRRDLTGSVASLTNKQIENIPVSSASEAIQGKLAGVQVTTTEGSPDADIKIRVRGGGSLSQDNSPLYIVDGFPVTSIGDIPPSDIKSIDVLKDASSTAIYGARGANGVIIVTTKSGRQGKTEVDFNASFGVRNRTDKIGVLNPYEFAMYQWELGPADMFYGVYDDLDIYKSKSGTNWQDEIFGRTGTQQQYNVSVSGGSDKTTYSVSYARNEEKSIMYGSGYNKDNVNAKIKTELNKWLSFDFNGRMNYSVVRGLAGGADQNESSAANSLVARSVIYAPIHRLNEDTEDDENTTNAQYDPKERLDDTYKNKRTFQQNYNIGLDWKPTKKLVFRSEAGYGWRYTNTDEVWGSKATIGSSFGYAGKPQAYLTRDDNKNWRNANTLTFNTDLFGGRDNLSILAGQEWSSSWDKYLYMTSVNYDADTSIDEVLSAMGNGTALPTTSYIGAKDNLLSFFGRANYSLMNRFIFTFTFRADGSSKFASGHRWGYFPSGAFAWRVNEEKFMEKARPWLSDLKLRLSYGLSGNNRIPSGVMYSTYALGTTSDRTIYYNETGAVLLKHGSVLSNPKLKWETTVSRNLGIDFGMWNNRIYGNIDVYWNTTKDLLMRTAISSQSGYSYQYRNFGQTSNKGAELQLSAVLANKKDFSLNLNFNISYNRAKIDKLNGGSLWQSSAWNGSGFAGTNDFYLEEGGRLGNVYGYKYDGIYTADDFDFDVAAGTYTLKSGVFDSRTAGSGLAYNYFGPGSIKLKEPEKDADGNYKKSKLGNTIPPFTGGFGLNGQYKGFDFSVFLNYSFGNKIVNATKMGSSTYDGTKKGWNVNDNFTLAKRYSWIDPTSGQSMLSASFMKQFSSSADYVAYLNKVNEGKTMWNPASATTTPLLDWAVEDGSFLRLNNVTIGYTLPERITRKIFINKIRIYVTGYNLYCFTKYSGADPEVDTRRSTPMTPGIDYAAYPKSRSFVGGINVSF